MYKARYVALKLYVLQIMALFYLAFENNRMQLMYSFLKLGKQWFVAI